MSDVEHRCDNYANGCDITFEHLLLPRTRSPLRPSQGRAESPFREAGSALARGPVAAPGRCPGLPPVP